MLLSTAIHAATLLARLLFWTGAWLFLKKYLRDTTYTLTNRMWLIVDTLMLASVVSIFTIIYFMPERIIIVYPICAASIFSSFGCIYLASYMCGAMQTAWHAQELEMRQNYYEEKMEDETRIRQIYHDMKNHLLVLENVMADTEPAASFTENVSTDSVHPSIRHLRQQMESYENYYRTGNLIWTSSSGTRQKLPAKNRLTSPPSSTLPTEASWTRWISAPSSATPR